MSYVREGHGRKKPAWRTNTHKPTGKRIGIELEIENKQGYQAILDALPETDNDDLRPVTESDGSLNPAWGVEIVFPPYSHGSLRLEGSFFGRSIKALADSGCEVSANCGMHMNINTDDWTDREKSVFMCWIHWMKPTALAKIGGRTLNNWCTQSPGMRLGDALQHQQHVTCAGIRPNRIEVRFPLATLEHQKIKNLTNFFSHLEDFCKLDTTYEWMLAQQNTGQVLRREAMLTKFCEYLDTKVRVSKSAPIIKDVLINGY